MTDRENPEIPRTNREKKNIEANSIAYPIDIGDKAIAMIPVRIYRDKVRSFIYFTTSTIKHVYDIAFNH